jgi:cytoskeletal protein CcmA (bactofilin family)
VTSNTTIGGTLDVTNATNITNTLGVTGVTSITNNSVATTTGSYSGNGALRVTGGASIGNNLVVSGDVRLYGNSVIDGTVSYASIQTYAENVRFNDTADAVSASNNVASVFTAGGLAVSKKAYIGDDLNVGNGNFTVDGPTGNTLIVGTLGVTAATNVSTITASGIADLQSTVTIGGNLAIGSNKFNVNSSNGNTDIDGSLDILGATVIDDTLNVTQGVDFDSTLNVDGTTTLNDALTQNSTSLFKDNVVIRGATKTLKLQNGNSQDKITLESTTGHVTMAGNLVTSGTGSFTDAVTMGNTLGVTGQITGNLTGDVTGTATNANNIDVNNTNNNTTFYPTFSSSNTGHTGMFVDSANLTYNPFSNTLSVTNFVSTTNFEVQGNLNITGTITFGQSQVGSIANHNTNALAEGSTNLYFTDERVDDRVAALISGGTGITASYDDAGNLLTLSATQADINTDNITEGSTNLFTTAARTRGHISVSGDLGYNSGTGVISYTIPTTIASISNHDTADLAEGTNLYYTNARADARVNLQTGANLDLSSKSTSNLSEGTNLYYTNARADARVVAGITGKLDASDVSTFGGTLIDDADAAAARTTLGLGTAATTAATAYATSAQGTLAASATQPGDLATVATSGSYNDLSNLPTLFSGAYADLTGKPTLGTAAATASTAYATAAQGATADSALQAETITLAALKTAAANSATYAAFQAAIAAL